MDRLVYLLPALGCAVMMGAMMWMMRGDHKPAAGNQQPPASDAATAQEIAALRAEISALRTQTADPTAGTNTSADRVGGGMS